MQAETAHVARGRKSRPPAERSRQLKVLAIWSKSSQFPLPCSQPDSQVYHTSYFTLPHRVDTARPLTAIGYPHSVTVPREGPFKYPKMDWISVSAGCSAASDAISKTSLAFHKFVREVRESRSEFDTISAELHSLNGALDLLRYDAASFSPSLAKHTPRVLDSCLALIDELEGCVSLLNRPEVSRAEKRSRWLANRDHIGILWRTLSEYNIVFGLAADLVGLTKMQTCDADHHNLPEDQQDEPGDDLSGDNELALVTDRLIEITSHLESDPQQSVALARLGQYLHVLQRQAIAAEDQVQPRLDSQYHHGGSSSVDGAPDSAIDVSYDDLEGASFSARKQATTSPSVSISFESLEEEINEFVGELSEMPTKAPAVPPRSASRLGSANRSPDLSTSPTVPPRSASRLGSAPADSCPNRPTSPIRVQAPEPYFRPVTELPEQIDDRPPRPETRTHSRRSSIFGQVLYSVWENPRTEVPSPTRPTTSGGEMQHMDRQTGLLRRSGSKLSTTFRSLGLRRPSLKTVDDNLGVDSTAVFGVSLTRSIQLAKGIANARHGNDGSSVRSTREYPLCVLRCVYHIRSCGLDTPDIFGLDGDQMRLSQLKETFNSAGTSYGKELDWSMYAVHDAADLILLYLTELPKPVISESVGKRWISMSRQATVRGGRLDQGLDFWEEALMGIHGPRRTLFKLLLNLWGDVADAAEANEMTAERLAGRVIRPLMHEIAARRPTDFLLGLAFLIRKRSEYNLAARGTIRKSNAAF